MTGAIAKGKGPVSLAVVMTLGLLLGVSAAPAAASSSRAAQPTTVQAFMTLYGYVDNSPPGTVIAHGCIHSQAGGAGTYADPITFATDVNELPWCVEIYVPYMERYFIHEDECSQCDQDWNQSHLYRFDMWAGGDSGSLRQPERKALLHCESTWTRADSNADPNNPSIIVNPPPNLPVTTEPIFSPPTSCWQPISMGNPGTQSSGAGTDVSVPISATDWSPDQTLRYAAVGLPVGLSINASSGVISGTPTARRRSRVTVSASDAYNSARVQFIWDVHGAPRSRAR